jgi:hypothetical protein
MKVLETIEYTEKGLYRNRKISIRKDEEGNIHFFEENSEDETEFETSIETIKWCVSKGKLPRSINPYIPLKDGEKLITEVFYNYKGTSKKLTTKKVIILSKTSNRCKVQDMNGNETSVAESQLTLTE